MKIWMAGIAVLAVQLLLCWGAEYLEARRHRRGAVGHSYILGYWLGVNFLFFALVLWAILLVGVAGWIEFDMGTNFGVLLASGLCLAVGIGILTRDRWALTLGIVATLNPILWGIGGVYVWKRWEELEGESLGEIAQLPGRAWRFALARTSEISRAVQGR